jgi:thiosulfate dehydrogenase
MESGFTKKEILIGIATCGVVIALIVGCVLLFIRSREEYVMPQATDVSKTDTDSAEWRMPDTATLGNSEEDKLIKYGRDLIARTSYYLGPKGTVAPISNGMNCQNCHLNAGTKIFGNNYSAVAPTYPKFRERSGGMEDIYKRVNDCLQRSLNGKALDTLSREMQAIQAYILWLGSNVKKGVKPKGSGITELAYIERAADPEKGKIVYIEKCQNCHAEDGEGKMTDSIFYPPLWGKKSYNIGAGLLRLSRFAGYVKSNMPYGTNYDNPQLSDEEAWDVAAFVNSQPRPAKDLSKDWPRIGGKPVDHPFGPYEDEFSEQQHKYGPFGPIAVLKKKKEAEKNAN